MLPNTEENDGRFWSVNDNFCVPDSVYHPTSNPDGRLKLGKLVEMCRALYDSSVAFDIPMTSGKDSMKNDFIGGGQKISVPPTVLYSIAARIDDVRRMVTTTFKAPGDLIYLAGETYDELGASEYYAMLGHLGCSVPLVRRERARKLYLRIMAANREQLIQSCHDLSDGGLAAAAAECTFGSNLGAEISLESMEAHPPHVLLFSESHSRFIISIRPADREPFEELLGSRAALLGEVSRRKHLVISHNGRYPDRPIR